jgi:DNA primase catalytic subunit
MDQGVFDLNADERSRLFDYIQEYCTKTRPDLEEFFTGSNFDPKVTKDPTRVFRTPFSIHVPSMRICMPIDIYNPPKLKDLPDIKCLERGTD